MDTEPYTGRETHEDVTYTRLDDGTFKKVKHVRRVWIARPYEGELGLKHDGFWEETDLLT